MASILRDTITTTNTAVNSSSMMVGKSSNIAAATTTGPLSPPSHHNHSQHPQQHDPRKENHAACVEESTRINNMGIAALACGNVAPALACFRRALKPLIQQLRQEAQDEAATTVPLHQQPQQNHRGHDRPVSAVSPAAAAEQPRGASGVLPMTIMDIERCLATSCPVNANSGSNNGADAVDPLASLHARPFGLVETPFSDDHIEDSKIRFSIVCFNLALIFHLQGLLEHSQTTERLHKAKSMYQNIFRLLAERIELGPTGNAVVDMVFMAMLNNMAHVALELADANQPIAQQLLVVASRVQVTSYGSDERISKWMQQHSRIFLLNVVAGAFTPPSIAAAA
eukprot:CAMPEP_0119547498 /NCGR_PEP_ID=MMETSP1352-20130426/1607_1 /TAXON_ID=265584 /ORGANISM="Stauroneis constricta, Strain CCMP1120" /LENGTH=339 /DNA_ID=CAMNT_0007592445 /DNA_START=90 /DNA_END=1109 /DNA_ORIENTATION=+